MQDLLAPSRLEAQGMLDSQHYATAMSEHLSGVRDRRAELWHALMFQAWVDSQDIADAQIGPASGQRQRPRPRGAISAMREAGGPEAARLPAGSDG
jgi:hypothetical protein